MKSNRNVAMVLSNPFTNDPRVYKEAIALIKSDYHVKVFAWDRDCIHPKHDCIDGIVVERIRVKSTYELGILQVPALLLFSFRVILSLSRSQYEVIHCHNLETLLVGILASCMKGLEIVFDAHETVFYSDTRGFRWLTVQMGKIIERLLVKRASCAIMVNDFQYDKYQKMGVRNLKLVPNYPECHLVAQPSSPCAKPVVVIGRIGSIYADAGIEELIDAFDLLRKEYIHVKLMVVGTAGGGDLDLIKKKISAIGSGARFVSGYHYSERGRYYSQIDICIIASHPNSWHKYVPTPTKLFETLGFGVPVITTGIGQRGRIIKEENCGIVIDEVSPESIADAAKILIGNPELRRKMGENGQRAIREKYNWDISVKELLAAYKCLPKKSKNQKGN